MIRETQRPKPLAIEPLAPLVVTLAVIELASVDLHDHPRLHATKVGDKPGRDDQISRGDPHPRAEYARDLSRRGEVGLYSRSQILVGANTGVSRPRAAL